MKRRSTPVLLLATALTLSAPFSFSQTNTIVLPREAEASFGDSWEPAFAYGGPYMEQIYAATEFDMTPDVILITEIAFRLDDSSTNAVEANWLSLEMALEVFPGSMDDVVQRKSGLTNSPPPFYDFPPDLVFDGQFRIVAGRAEIDSFDVRFPLQRPFIYNRRCGQLVLV